MEKTKLNRRNLWIYLYLFVMMIIVCWVCYSISPNQESHLTVQRGESKPSPSDTSNWFNDHSEIADDSILILQHNQNKEYLRNLRRKDN